MGWFSSSYRKRIPFPAYNVTPTSPIDLSFQLYPEDSRFWSTVDENGHGVQWTFGDGVTAYTHDRQAWDYAARTATFEIDNATFTDPATAKGIEVVWLYFDVDSPSDTSSAFALGAAIGDDAYAGDPSQLWDLIVVASVDVPGAAEPGAVLVKSTSEEVLCWIDWGDVLYKREADDQAGQRAGEEVIHFSHDIENGGVSLGGGGFDNAFNRCYETDGGRFITGHHMAAGGSDGDTYTLIATIHTSSQGAVVERILQQRVLILVIDPDDP